MLASDGLGEDIVRVFERAVAADAFVYEICVLAIGFEVGAAPAGPAPAERVRVFGLVADHKFHLEKFAGANHAVGAGLLEPRDFREGGAVGPRIDLIFGDGFDGDVVAENLADGVVVEAFGAADWFPVFVIGREKDAVGRGVR